MKLKPQRIIAVIHEGKPLYFLPDLKFGDPPPEPKKENENAKPKHQS